MRIHELVASQNSDKVERARKLAISYQPDILAKGLDVIFCGINVDWGRLPTGFAGTMAWILPNPSGLNRGFTLDALVGAYTAFRIALAQEAG